MNQSNVKRQQFANEIRRKQRFLKKAEMRSKLIKIIQAKDHESEQSLNNLSFLELLVPNKQRKLDKIKELLGIIIGQSLRENKNQIPLEGGKGIIEHILTKKNNDFIQINSNTTTRHQLYVQQFEACLLELPKLMCKLINVININITKLKHLAVTSPQNIEEVLQGLGKIKQCRDVKQINFYCNLFIQQYSRMLENIECHNINLNIIELITDCLIEGSYFKPQQLMLNHSTQHCSLLATEINQEMNILGTSLNFQICSSLVSVISHFTFENGSIKLFINYIYIVGNIFITIGTQQQNGEHAYQYLNRAILTQFSINVNQVLLKTADPKCVPQIFEDINKLLQLCSLAVWFIRNELLIVEGLFNRQNQTHLVPSEMSKVVNQYWLKIILDIFKILANLYNYQVINKQTIMDKPYVQLILDVISLIQIMYNDFEVNQNSLSQAIANMIWFRQRVDYQVEHQRILYRKIYDFYLNLIFSAQKQEWKDSIFEEAVAICNGQILCPNGFKFCAKIIDPSSRVTQKYKLNLFIVVCNNIDRLMQLVAISDKYDERMGLVSLLFSATKQYEFAATGSNMSFQLLSDKKLYSLVNLCGLIWEEQKNDQDIIQTLEFLKQLAGREQYASFLKQIILDHGFYEQLQNLSSNVHEQINSLVYDIYQLLDIN